MMRTLAAILLILIGTVPAMAQSICSNGLPCGSIPWPLPVLPNLVSPTPMPTAVATATPTITHTPTATATHTATATPTATLDPSVSPTLTATPTFTATATVEATSTPLLDTSGVEDAIATIQALSEATAEPFIEGGTPVSLNDQTVFLGANAGEVFGYIRGLQNANIIGRATPMLFFTFVVLLVVMSVKLITFIGPIIAVLVGLVRKAISTIMDFLPL